MVMKLKVSFVEPGRAAYRSLEVGGQRIPMYSTSSRSTAKDKRGRTKSIIQYAGKRLCLFNQVNSKGCLVPVACDNWGKFELIIRESGDEGGGEKG